ncbi:cysteine desulfurase family protein [Terrilactibacillus laevilacticus]|uniref:cysteine desulfurase n=1 Tax=Terrilactibacillus laevilacticus TaxID=1380157 RepID=A0ABW5PU84_9BACI|nr:cysteine desulfurase family protein [Terrilactibacillus laevilacticus]
MEPIYLDHAATTPIHPKVLEEMIRAYETTPGNPSSIHRFGRDARKLIERSRDLVAKDLGTESKQIVFTSGGTEADNMAIIGTAFSRKDKGKHIITTKIEHHAVLKTCEYLETLGFEVDYLNVNEHGVISMEDLKNALRDDTILVSIMYGNNEVGSIQPIRDIANLLESHQAVFHTDAVQAYGSIDIDVQDTPIDLLSMTAHKINGPKGIGFLYIRKGVQLDVYQHGGEQERKRRAGTQNVPGIVGLAKAVLLSKEDLAPRTEKYMHFRQCLLDIFDESGIEYKVNGDPKYFLPHILNVYFPGANVETLLTKLDLAGVAVSSGSACTAGSIEPSHVLSAMFGKNADESRHSIRISFGRDLSLEQVKEAGQMIVKSVRDLVKN